MRLSTSTNIAAFLPEPGLRNGFDFCIELCSRAGYRVLDLNLCEAMNPKSRMRGDDWQIFVRDIAELGRRWDVEFSQSHLPYYDIFAPRDSEQVKFMEELIRRCIIASGELGVKWAVTHPGTLLSISPEISLEKNLEYYAPHVETAKNSGLGIALENDFENKRVSPRETPGTGSSVGPASPGIVDKGSQGFSPDIPGLCKLADALGSSHAGICYDFGHASLSGGSHRENLGMIGKRLKATHVQDNNFINDDHLMPFFGRTDWNEAMSALADCGYEGDLTFEIQEFGRYLPNELKHLTAELSIKIGNYLLEIFEARRRR